MDNKGFTLIELLACLVLFILISIVVGVGVDGMLDKRNEENYTVFKETIENAACTYVELSKNIQVKNNCRAQDCYIKVKDLIKEGLISSDLENPNTKEKIDEYTLVKVYWDNNEKKCEYGEEKR